jgi:DNA-binding HxlR family transcriptional regulator
VKFKQLLGALMRSDHKSGCPINLTLEILGDKWSLMIIRDMIFGNRRHFRNLMQNSEEGIASNILADRLKNLLDQGIISKAEDPSHKQKVIYSLTERGIELLPVLAQMVDWGRRHLPVSRQHDLAAQVIVEGGPKMLRRFMDELRTEHLGRPAHRKSTQARSPSIAMFWQNPRSWRAFKAASRKPRAAEA